MKQLEVINFESFAKVYPAYNELFSQLQRKTCGSKHATDRDDEKASKEKYHF